VEGAILNFIADSLETRRKKSFLVLKGVGEVAGSKESDAWLV
jgi:hypothetical protein